jgi:hypothetical protein
MMYSTEKFYPKTESELLNLLSAAISGKNKVVIVGGHFMLFYDKVKNELQPVIFEDLEKDNQKLFAKQFAGNFPLKSFQYSVDLYKLLENRNIDSGILLLVNDHKFQSESFQKNISTEIIGRGGELRQAYFRRNKIPEIYLHTLKEKGIECKNILVNNNDVKRKESDLLPKESWYYSEQKLRKRFDKYVAPKLLKNEKIYQVESGKGTDIFFQTPNIGTELCLTENGSCGCSAEVIEFISNLLNRGVTEIVFFVPNECANAVDSGIMAALGINEKSAKVITISNFGGMGFNESLNLPFTVVDHIFHIS